ncbi:MULTISPECIES: serine protease [Streptomyces]|uniref:Secreted serine protease n=1 Tax=Streptomyces coelicolor (strain ATCC BAA-471 / A3(2) / M145) TaxID=100226 RepID=Q9K3X9_STRCO|nr:MULTISPECIES: serine protease [Streptomyces]MDX2930227.1 serine protease [Streptomyces sp. NRRL_B-16638]MYU40880.1 serine protease [Streptomyces sp. SID7813]NSL80808.1 serine protease [Streptomyces coelicolor]QFI41571.1 S8 family peptidase [Streptomyces coelicolor A3(2)]QKN65220.1 serine protease [Streptomyces coelicolor]
MKLRKFDARAIRGLLAAGATSALLVGAAAVNGAAAPVPPDDRGHIVGADRAGAVEGSYIVTLKDNVARADVPASAKALAKRHGGSLRYTYTTALRGFAVKMTERRAEELAADPSVARVEADAVAYAVGTQPDPPSWGLDRIDQRDLPVDRSYTYPGGAPDVTAYVVDTGVRLSHNDFGGRAVSGYDFIDDDSNASDCQGHGTHVAGTVGGASHGVAKAVRLVGVRVLNCQGTSGNTWAPVLAGIDWVTRNADGPSVANMSIGGGRTQSVNDAVDASVASGVTWVVAAGNNNADACSYSPSSTPAAVTVGATDSRDARASGWSNGQGSNYGSCLDIFAPGDTIVSASNAGDSASRADSGTSMASPHVAGAAALLLSAHPDWSPAQVRDRLVADATSGKVTDPRNGSPNRLLFTGTGDDTQPPTDGERFENTDDHPIRDGATVESPLTVTGVSGNAPADLSVTVDIRHTYRGDLRVELVAPDGDVFLLKDYAAYDGTDDVRGTFAVNASGKPANGTWKLRVSDNWVNDTGHVDAWSLRF